MRADLACLNFVATFELHRFVYILFFPVLCFACDEFPKQLAYGIYSSTSKQVHFNTVAL
jgi:hypothetical protein